MSFNFYFLGQLLALLFDGKRQPCGMVHVTSHVSTSLVGELQAKQLGHVSTPDILICNPIFFCFAKHWVFNKVLSNVTLLLICHLVLKFIDILHYLIN